MNTRDVEATLTRAGHRASSKRRYGYRVEVDAQGNVLVHWANATSVAALGDRITHLMRMRETLKSRHVVNLYGSHFKDGRPVCLIVRERIEASESATSHLDLAASH